MCTVWANLHVRVHVTEYGDDVTFYTNPGLD